MSLKGVSLTTRVFSIKSPLLGYVSARGVTLRSVTADVEGDIDLQGILGLSNDVRNGYEQIRISFTIDADAPDETIAAIVEQSRARSAVFDVLTNGVPVAIDVTSV